MFRGDGSTPLHDPTKTSGRLNRPPGDNKIGAAGAGVVLPGRLRGVEEIGISEKNLIRFSTTDEAIQVVKKPRAECRP